MVTKNFKVDLKGVKILSFLFRKRLDTILVDKAKKLLKYSVEGSSRVSEKAPIDFGVLRQSASAFVGKKYVGKSKWPVREGSKTVYPPEMTNSEKDKNKITIIFNAPYALRMHEVRFNPGEGSIRSGNSNPGNRWLTKHLYGDGHFLFDEIGKDLKKEIFSK